MLCPTTIYKILESSLKRQYDGKLSRGVCTLNSMKPTSGLEPMFVSHVLRLDDREYMPVLTDAEDMAHFLLAERSELPVGKNWTGAFVNRHSELTLNLN